MSVAAGVVPVWHLVIPSNPLVAMLHLNMAGYGALNGHIGFDKLELIEFGSRVAKALLQLVWRYVSKRMPPVEEAVWRKTERWGQGISGRRNDGASVLIRE